MDKPIENWLKNRSDRELQSLAPLITGNDEQLWDKIGHLAFAWVTNHCNELSDMAKEIGSGNAANAQLDCIERYRKLGECVCCNSKLSGILAKYDELRNKNPDVYPIEALFLTVHGYSGLCTDCIGGFLLREVAR